MSHMPERQYGMAPAASFHPTGADEVGSHSGPVCEDLTRMIYIRVWPLQRHYNPVTTLLYPL